MFNTVQRFFFLGVHHDYLRKRLGDFVAVFNECHAEKRYDSKW